MNEDIREMIAIDQGVNLYDETLEDMDRNEFYRNGKCLLIKGVEQKCMYSEKYVFCFDCTRKNIIDSE